MDIVPEPWMRRCGAEIAAALGMPTLAPILAECMANARAKEELGGELADVRAEIHALDKQIEEEER